MSRNKWVFATKTSAGASNYRIPAEWEAHEATWLVWPKNKTTWPGKLLKEVESIYLRMISELLNGEKVHLLVDDEKTAGTVLKSLSRKVRTQNLIFHKVKTVDIWIRDYGPIFVEMLTGPAAAA